MKDILQVQIIDSGLDLSDYLAIITVICSWFSIVLTINYNKKNFALMVNQYEQKLPNICFSTEKYFKKILEDDFITYQFYVKVQNKSESSNSINDIELRINYVIDGKKMSLNIKPESHFGEIKLLENPIIFNSKEIKVGWIVFKLLRTTLSDKNIDSYDLMLYDIHSNVMQDKFILINMEV